MQLDLIEARQREPLAQSAFKHVFTQESVYDSLLLSDRRQLHQQVGEALEKLFADTVADQALLLAHHFEKSKDKAKAFEYLRMAAGAARAAFAFARGQNFV